jgi:hypothetical protein
MDSFSSSFDISIVHLTFQSICTAIVIVSSIVIFSSYFGQDDLKTESVFHNLFQSSSDK